MCATSTLGRVADSLQVVRDRLSLYIHDVGLYLIYRYRNTINNLHSQDSPSTNFKNNINIYKIVGGIFAPACGQGYKSYFLNNSYFFQNPLIHLMLYPAYRAGSNFDLSWKIWIIVLRFFIQFRVQRCSGYFQFTANLSSTQKHKRGRGCSRHFKCSQIYSATDYGAHGFEMNQ